MNREKKKKKKTKRKEKGQRNKNRILILRAIERRSTMLEFQLDRRPFTNSRKSGLKARGSTSAPVLRNFSRK